jgi:DNA-binding response OmpR family regulator
MPDHGSSFSDEIRARVEALESTLGDLRSGEPGGEDSLRRLSRSISHAAERFGLPDLQRKAGGVITTPSVGLPEEAAALLDLLKGYLGQGEVRATTLLLVEDDPDMLRLLERILSAPERRILTAVSGSEMEVMLAEHRLDLILMDLFLPDADGRDLLLRIREGPATAALPVIVCSAVPAAEAKTESLALGADDYLEKPIDPGLARAAVAAALRKAFAKDRDADAQEVMDRTVAGGREGTGVQHRFRVLLAEDDPLTAALVHHRLTRDGFEVHGFDDGLEAFAAAREGRHDLVILDVKLPGMDGFELLERIRALPDTGSLPVVMLTAMGREEDIVRGLRLGANDYVLKPFSPAELSARIRRLLKA